MCCFTTLGQQGNKNPTWKLTVLKSVQTGNGTYSDSFAPQTAAPEKCVPGQLCGQLRLY